MNKDLETRLKDSIEKLLNDIDTLKREGSYKDGRITELQDQIRSAKEKENMYAGRRDSEIEFQQRKNEELMRVIKWLIDPESMKSEVERDNFGNIINTRMR